MKVAAKSMGTVKSTMAGDGAKQEESEIDSIRNASLQPLPLLYSFRIADGREVTNLLIKVPMN